MREKLETLPLPELRAIAKAKGMKKNQHFKKRRINWPFSSEWGGNRSRRKSKSTKTRDQKAGYKTHRK